MVIVINVLDQPDFSPHFIKPEHNLHDIAKQCELIVESINSLYVDGMDKPAQTFNHRAQN